MRIGGRVVGAARRSSTRAVRSAARPTDEDGGTRPVSTPTTRRIRANCDVACGSATAGCARPAGSTQRQLGGRSAGAAVLQSCASGGSCRGGRCGSSITRCRWSTAEHTTTRISRRSACRATVTRAPGRRARVRGHARRRAARPPRPLRLLRLWTMFRLRLWPVFQLRLPPALRPRRRFAVDASPWRTGTA